MNGIRKLGMALAALFALATVLFYLRFQNRPPAPSAPGYYTGPMANKAGQMVDDNGKSFGIAKRR